MAGSIRASGRHEGPRNGPSYSPDGPAAPAKPWRPSTSLATNAGAAILILALGSAVAAPVLAPHDPLRQNLGNALARPGRAHLLGTDNVGRDVLSRVIWGTRISLVAGFVSVAMALLTGGVLGLVAGYSGGRVDGLVMRAMDAVLSFPPLVLALALGAMLGAGRLVGQHDQRRPRLPAAGALDRLRAWRRALRHSGRPELRRGRRAGRAGSATLATRPSRGYESGDRGGTWLVARRAGSAGLRS